MFDEPTSVLTPAESEQLFAVLRRVVSEEGRTVALVSHKLDEILHATDEITIMRSGRVVERLPTADATAARLAQDMVGRPVSLRSEAAALGLVVAVADEARRSEAADQIAAEVASTSAAPTVGGCSTASRSTSGRARSWGWPAWRATASGCWPTRSRVWWHCTAARSR